MVSYRIRPATPEDLDLLVRHRRGMWEEILKASSGDMDAADRDYRRWARPRLRSGALIGFVAETASGEPAASGCIWLMPSQPRPMWKGTTVPYLMSMFTERAHRGHGLATRITRAAVAWSKDHGYDHIVLHASRFGRPVYAKEGFVRFSREMRLKLDDVQRGRKGRASR